MKKNIFIGLFIGMFLFVSGCGYYPNIRIYLSFWRDEVDIIIGDEFKLRDYNRIDNKDGSCQIIINFDKK